MTLTSSPSQLDRLDDADLAERLHAGGSRIAAELRKVIVGQEAVVEQALIALFAGGNCLVVGVPGLAKTLLIHSLSRALDLTFSRIQFTPDLMPSDVTGTDMIQDDPVTGHRAPARACGREASWRFPARLRAGYGRARAGRRALRASQTPAPAPRGAGPLRSVARLSAGTQFLPHILHGLSGGKHARGFGTGVACGEQIL